MTRSKPLTVTTRRKLVAVPDTPEKPQARSDLPDKKGKKRAIAERKRKR